MIPKYICKLIDETNKNFFWNKNKEGNGANAAIPIIVWDQICRPKSEGNLSIRKNEDLIAAF